MDKRYGGVIWTNHALNRLAERLVNQEDAWYTFQHPQKSEYAKTQGAWKYTRTTSDTRLEVIAKQNERKEWIILSVWSHPVVQELSKPSLLMRILGFLGLH